MYSDKIKEMMADCAEPLFLTTQEGAAAGQGKHVAWGGRQANPVWRLPERLYALHVSAIKMLLTII